MSSKVSDWKRQMIDSLLEKFKGYPVIGLVDLNKVRASQIHEMRKMLRGKVEMTVSKKNLMKKAAEQVEKEKENIREFFDSIEGAPMLIFTELDPFSLTLLMEKNKIKVSAKEGDIATGDIVIPAGNTGIPPGPVISEFGEVKVPTKIESGSIWVSKDTLVARKGEAISSKLASLLSRLAMKPIEARLTLYSAYEKGVIFTKDSLELNLEELEASLQEAAYQAFNLALNASILLKETTPAILGRAHMEALTLASEAAYTTDETVESILAKAYYNALTLQAKVGKE